MVKQSSFSTDADRDLRPRLDTADIEEAVDLVKAEFVSDVKAGKADDLAFIGNASGIYPWEPCLMVDLDVCLFLGQMDETAGSWLAALRDRLGSIVSRRGIDFELRIINGPYKPPISALQRPVIVAHLAVFTEERYLKETANFRWCWRKYPCLVDEHLLLRLASHQPSLHEVVSSATGITDRLAVLESGRVVMKEWLLPDFRVVDLEVSARDANFAEYCFSAATTCARDHCRALEFDEADTLPNRAFFPWYQANVFPSEDLEQLLILKEHSRNEGFGASTLQARELAIGYLHALRRHLSGAASSGARRSRNGCGHGYRQSRWNCADDGTIPSQRRERGSTGCSLGT